MSLTKNADFNSAIYQLAEDNGIPKEDLIEILKESVKSAYKRMVPVSDEVLKTYEVDFDEETGLPIVLATMKVVKKVSNSEIEIAESNAKLIDSNLKEGDSVQIDITPENFGRIAAQAAKQKIFEGIRNKVREAVVAIYEEKLGKIISGLILRKDTNYVRVEIDRTEAVLPNEEQIPNEEYRSPNRMKFLLKNLAFSETDKRMVVSRADPDFISALFALEVPEIDAGNLKIVKIAREPGNRSKVAVSSLHEKVDAIGACVGPKGSRIDAIMSEVNPEKIDIIEYSDDIKTYIINSLSPARVVDIRIIKTQKYAKLLVAEDMLSLAIGRDGQNVRLASKLTGYKIDITSDKDSFKKAGILKREVVDEAIKKAEEMAQEHRMKREGQRAKEAELNESEIFEKENKEKL